MFEHGASCHVVVAVAAACTRLGIVGEEVPAAEGTAAVEAYTAAAGVAVEEDIAVAVAVVGTSSWGYFGCQYAALHFADVVAACTVVAAAAAAAAAVADMDQSCAAAGCHSAPAT